jgi:hypothetical protein
MALGITADPQRVRSTADHIARFSMAGLRCEEGLVEEALKRADEADLRGASCGERP